MASRSRDIVTARRRPGGDPAGLVWVLAALLTAAGCRPRAVHGARPQPPKAKAAPTPVDPSFERDGELDARHFELTQRLLSDGPASFARSTPAQRALLKRLRAHSTIRTRVYLTDQRALIVPQARQPAGALELLIAADRDELVVFADDRWAHHLPLERLPDVLDRGEPSRRHSFKPLLLDLQPPRTPHPQRTTAPLGGSSSVRQLTYKYQPRHKQASWAIRTELEVLTSMAPRHQWLDELLYALMLPQLQTRHGRLIAESLELEIGTPVGWRRKVTNESFASAPAVRFSTELDDRGWVRLPIRRFALQRDNYRAAGRLGPPDEPGAQLVAAEQLGELRAGEGAKTLRLDNRSPVAALVFLEGAMVGWVAPGRQLALEGLREGFYRISAVAPTGIRGWGPYDRFVPGTITLR